MIRVHADRVAFEIEGELAELDVLQLILVKVWPAPYARVDHVGKAFAPSHLLQDNFFSRVCIFIIIKKHK